MYLRCPASLRVPGEAASGLGGEMHYSLIIGSKGWRVLLLPLFAHRRFPKPISGTQGLWCGVGGISLCRCTFFFLL